MIVDLVSPWLAAVEATDSTRARGAFRNRHAPLLEVLRLARTPTEARLPLAADASALRGLARRAADPTAQQLLRDVLARSAALGGAPVDAVFIIAGDGGGDDATVLSRPPNSVALFAEQVGDDTACVLALARVIAALTRAVVSGSATSSRWDAARNLPLREQLYTEGVGVHLAAALLPDLPPHRLFSLNQAAFSRLRERERLFRELLDADLDQRGVGLALRWLSPRAPLGPRTIGNVVLPPMAGSYLAWRMTAERVARVGLGDALRADA